MSDAPTQKAKNSRPAPIKIFRKGAVAASVWKRQTSTGFEYLDFSLHRTWQLKTNNKEGCSNSFFAENADAIAEVSLLASEFISESNATFTKQVSNEFQDKAEDYTG